MFGLKSKREREIDIAKRSLVGTATGAIEVEGDGHNVMGSIPVGEFRGAVPVLASTLQRYCVDWIPEGVVIKRISSRGTKNKWGVWYFTSPTKYYARTLDEAFTEFFRNNKKYLEIYNLNAVESQHEQRSN